MELVEDKKNQLFGIKQDFITRFPHFFAVSAGILLLITALAKIISAFGKTGILDNIDPLFAISFRHLMLLSGTLELIVALVCLFGKQLTIKIGLILWIVANCVNYRVGLAFVGWHRPCICLGNVTDALHITPRTADILLDIVLFYLFVPSCALVIHSLKCKTTRFD